MRKEELFLVSMVELINSGCHNERGQHRPSMVAAGLARKAPVIGNAIEMCLAMTDVAGNTTLVLRPFVWPAMT